MYFLFSFCTINTLWLLWKIRRYQQSRGLFCSIKQTFQTQVLPACISTKLNPTFPLGTSKNEMRILKILPSSENPTSTFTGKICGFKAYRALTVSFAHCPFILFQILFLFAPVGPLWWCRGSAGLYRSLPAPGRCHIPVPKCILEMHWVVEQKLVRVCLFRVGISTS